MTATCLVQSGSRSVVPVLISSRENGATDAEKLR